MRADFGRRVWKFPAQMVRARPRRNAWPTSRKPFNSCWKPGAKRLCGSIPRRRWQNWLWHETQGIARPSSGTWLPAGSGRRQPFHLEQPANRTQGGCSAAQRNQETSGAFHLPQSIRAGSARRLTAVIPLTPRACGVRRSWRVRVRGPWRPCARSDRKTPGPGRPSGPCRG